jgi:hypothetical protein
MFVLLKIDESGYHGYGEGRILFSMAICISIAGRAFVTQC